MENKLTLTQKKRIAIIEAAIEAFALNGVQGTSMDKLAKHAGVSKRTIYNHFESKEHLVIFLLGELWRRALVDNHYDYCNQTSLESQLQSLLKQEIDFLSSQQYIDLARVACDYLFKEPSLMQEELAKFANHQTALFRWIDAAVADNKLVNIDVDFAKEQLHAVIKGNVMYPQMMHLKPGLTEEKKSKLVSETCQMFLARYQAKP